MKSKKAIFGIGRGLELILAVVAIVLVVGALVGFNIVKKLDLAIPGFNAEEPDLPSGNGGNGGGTVIDEKEPGCTEIGSVGDIEGFLRLLPFQKRFIHIIDEGKTEIYIGRSLEKGKIKLAKGGLDKKIGVLEEGIFSISGEGFKSYDNDILNKINNANIDGVKICENEL